MKGDFTKLLVLLVCGALYWLLVCHITGVKEPWDASTFWSLWYPVSLLLSAISGPFLKERGWTAGAIVTFAQFPTMWMNNGTGPLLVLGIVMLCVLAVPAVAASALTSWFALRPRP